MRRILRDSALPENIRRSLSISWKEGIPAAIMAGIVDYYMIPYALFLGASTPQIGFLISVPNLFGSITQLFAVRAVAVSGSRLRFVLIGAITQAAVLFLAATLALRSGPDSKVYALIFLLTVFRMMGHLIGTVWNSLVSDYLPPEQRGNYFGWRSSIVGIAGIAGIGIAGVLLSCMKEISQTFGYVLLFILASFSRAVSARLLSKMADVSSCASREGDFGFLEFIGRFRESNFVRYTLYVAGVIFATHISAPYFSVYMLRDLHFSYLQYMAIILAGTGTTLIVYPIWGRHADLVGNARILKTMSFLIPLIPLLWLISKNPVYLFGVEIFSGFVWGGFNLCVTNYIFDAVSPPKRVRCLGYFGLINGFAVFFGAFLGGILAEKLPPLLGYRILTLFLISGVLRFFAHFLLSGRFQEIRASVRRVSNFQLFFSAFGIKPLTAGDED
ncbi:MAG TPA: MFS transporter [Candidatus Omnitrophota bacterium]|nr:MFS transporter [Candidatus Omnitrophota bacterium]